MSPVVKSIVRCFLLLLSAILEQFDCDEPGHRTTTETDKEPDHG